MKTNDVLRESVQLSLELLEMMTADMNPEQLHWNPPGTAHSVAATLAHAALETDWQIHELYKGGTPRYKSDWAGKTGVSEPVPHQTLEWAQNVRLDKMAFDKYARAIYDDLDQYIENLSDEDQARVIDMSFVGLGERSLIWCVTNLIVGHLNNLIGEIAAVKGVQGLTGYPF